MGVSCSFMDNCMYGADDINLAFSKLTTEGVSLFKYSDGDNPLIELNNAVSGFTESGTQYYNGDSCRLIYDEENSTYKILSGNTFMCDGSIITIDEEGYDITDEIKKLRLSGAENIYVSFYRNVPNNNIEILVKSEDTLYKDSMSVPIGMISSDGKIIDQRIYAKSKIMPCSANVIIDFELHGVTFSYLTEGARRCRHIFNNIFPGIQYLLVKPRNEFWRIVPVQRVMATTGDELTYTDLSLGSITLKAAFNLVGTDMQFWGIVNNHTVDVNGWKFIGF